MNKTWMNPIFLVSRNEFLRVWKHALTPALIALLALFATLHGLVGTSNLGSTTHSETGLYALAGGSFIFMSPYLGIVAAFIGVMSISEERRNHAINVLLSKPLYRRDVIAGKVLGLNIYILGVVLFAMLLTTIALLAIYKVPVSPGDFMMRVLLYIVLLFVYASLNLSVAMLISIVFKDMLIAATSATAFIFFDLYTDVFALIPGMINFDPRAALCQFLINKTVILQNTGTTIGQWINANVANLFFFVASIAILLLVCMAAYTREETT